MPGWRFLNAGRVAERLRDEPHDVRSAVADALELLLENPYDPPGLEAHRMRVRNREDMMVAYLPLDWYVTYTTHPNGLPPLGGKLVVIRALVCDILP